MSGKKITTYLSTAAVVLALGALVASGTASAGGNRIECDADSASGDSSMDGKFESEGGREKFSASFEVADDGSFAVGDMLDVTVKGVIVGKITLAVEPNGDLGGDLNFDSTADADDDDSPFPANWPGAAAGNTVSVGTLGCSLN